MKQLDLFGFEIDESKNDTKYSKKVKSPIYTPCQNHTSIYECCDYQKYLRMVRRIEYSNVSAEEKAFLKYAATRHIAFNYEKIADYYANASKEMQELMESSALVIIDFGKAIEEGFIQLNESMRNLYLNEVEDRIDGQQAQE